MKKKKSITYNLIKTKICNDVYHNKYNRIDSNKAAKGMIIAYSKGFVRGSQSSFKALNTAFRALADL